MDKIFSTRLDEGVVVELERITRRLGVTKKSFLENAIKAHVQRLSAEDEADVWTETSGAWRRRESPQRSVSAIRTVMRKNFNRRHR